MSENKQHGVVIVGNGNVVGDHAVAVGGRGVAIIGGGNILEGSKPKLSVLFLPSMPTDASRLNLGEELREIQMGLHGVKLRDQYELHLRMSPRPADISQALLDIRPEIVHFAGHGTGKEGVYFENQMGEIQMIQPEFLTALFSTFADTVKLVVLDACYSAALAEAVAEHIEYVIGISPEIGDEAAVAFATSFYQALGTGHTIEEAYRLGCAQINLEGTSEHLAPVLRRRLSGMSGNLYQALRTTLSKCPEFRSYSSLRAALVAPELAPWRHGVPEADSTSSRVDGIIAYLSNRFDPTSGENALVLFLRALGERYAPDDILTRELTELADRFNATLRE